MHVTWVKVRFRHRFRVNT